MSTTSVGTFLWYEGDVREPVRFYQSLFPQLTTTAVIDYPDEVPGPENMMSIEFELFGNHFVAFQGGPAHPFTDAISIMVSVETQEDIDYYWDAFLANGGQEIACGWIKDKWGLSWQIVPSAVMGETLGGSDPEGAGRAVQAMLKMQKLDIAGLRAAYAGS